MEHEPRIDGVPLPARVARRPTWIVGQVAAHARRLLSEGFAAAGVRGYHYRLLAALDESGPASQAELARRTAIDRSDVVAALNELERRGCVARAPDPGDRRRNVVTLTPDGAELLRTLDATVDAVQERLLAPLSAPDRAVLMRLLERLL